MSTEKALRIKIATTTILFWLGSILQAILVMSRGFTHYYSVCYTVLVFVVSIAGLIAFAKLKMKPIRVFRVFSIVVACCVGVMLYCHYSITPFFTLPAIIGISITDLPLHIIISNDDEIRKAVTTMTLFSIQLGFLV